MYGIEITRRNIEFVFNLILLIQTDFQWKISNDVKKMKIKPL